MATRTSMTIWLKYLAVFYFLTGPALTLADDGPVIENITVPCMNCICKAISNCNFPSCIDNKCGPYHIPLQYWIDAGSPTVNGGPVEKGIEYFECVTDRSCAQRTVREYMTKFARDCNGDGVIDCDDYMLIQILGLENCHAEITKDDGSKYTQCMRETDPDFKIVSAACQNCICHAASGCNKTEGCFGNACGPYKITWPYWVDAGKVTIDGKPVSKGNEYITCVNDINCAQRTVEGYMKKYGKDCNGDGVMNCEDFSRIHFLGPYGCNGWKDKKLCQLPTSNVQSTINDNSGATASSAKSTPNSNPVMIIHKTSPKTVPEKPVQKVLTNNYKLTNNKNEKSEDKININLIWNNKVNDDYTRRQQTNDWDDNTEEETEESSDDDSDSSDLDLFDALFD